MFTLTYLRHELGRRKGRTVLTALGLAVGVALVAIVTALSNGLDRAQSRVLSPLSGVATDLLVTRPVDVDPQTLQAVTGGAGRTDAGAGGGALGGPPGGGRGGGGQGAQQSQEEIAALIKENQSVLTDLSKLGKPGERFVHDFFLPATQLTFPDSQVGVIGGQDGVEAVAGGLTLLATHQEGTVPEIVASVQTGGDTFDVQGEIEPPTDAESEQIQQCVSEKRKAGARGRAAFADCLPERFTRFRTRFTTPIQTINQALNPPQTDITSDPYSVAGVDPTKPDLALITPAQVSRGEWFSRDSATGQVLVAEAYASRKKLQLGSELNVNGQGFAVRGIVKPPLSGQSADVYYKLAELQALSDREGRVNVMLVRAESADQVGAVSKRITAAFPGSQVASAQDLADKVSGSLVNAANLVGSVGLVFSIVVLIVAVALASLLTLASVAKRVRELGTLKAIGWRQSRVVRQIVAESLAQGVIGAVAGVGLGVLGAVALAAFGPELQATAAAGATAGNVFGLGAIGAGAGSTAVKLQAPLDLGVIVLAVGLALLGGLAAGGAGALRAARLRPADALRELG